MIPTKTQCPSTWTLEYSGYLMSEGKWNDRSRTMYECVDKKNLTVGILLWYNGTVSMYTFTVSDT